MSSSWQSALAERSRRSALQLVPKCKRCRHSAEMQTGARWCGVHRLTDTNVMRELDAGAFNGR